DRTSFHAFTKSDAATTGEPRVRESLQHPVAIILQERLDLLIDPLFGHRSEVPAADRAIATDEERDRYSHDRSVCIVELVVPEQERVVHVLLRRVRAKRLCRIVE